MQSYLTTGPLQAQSASSTAWHMDGERMKAVIILLSDSISPLHLCGLPRYPMNLFDTEEKVPCGIRISQLSLDDVTHTLDSPAAFRLAFIC